MVCLKCGFEFEGIFCPECGTKNIDAIEKEKAERLRLEKEKKEQERLEKERKRQERVEKEKQEAERISKEKTELEARMYNGVVYCDESEARRAREENNMIDSLKQKLMLEKQQNQRRIIVDEFKEDIQTSEARKRLEYLRIKVKQEKPKEFLYNRIFGVTIIIAIIITIFLGNIDQTESALFIIVVLWYGLGIPIWIIWKIILLFKKKSKDYYLNIKHI